MLDVGTEAEEESIVKLYKYMIENPHCGGCCGEIEVDLNFSEKDSDKFGLADLFI